MLPHSALTANMFTAASLQAFSDSVRGLWSCTSSAGVPDLRRSSIAGSQCEHIDSYEFHRRTLREGEAISCVNGKACLVPVFHG
jgi:hypothetical protein